MLRTTLTLTAILVAAIFVGSALAQDAPAWPASGASDETIDLFMKAASTGDLKTLNDLINQNPNIVHARAKDGKTALHRAAMVGNTNAVQLLLDRGADVNARDNYRKTPLYYAGIARFWKTYKVLKYRGAKR